MRLFQLVLVVLLVATRVLAQDQAQVETSLIVESPITASPPAVLPDSPRPQKVIDKKFIVVLGALAASETLRISSNTLALDREFKEGAPWVTSAPSHWNISAKNGAIFASELLVAYELKKSHPWLPGDKVIRKLWWVYPVAMSVVHFKKAAHTMSMSAPAGCTPDQCELP